MPTKLIGLVLLASTLGFITIGDLFLPRPLSTYSRNTRQQINNWMMAAMPKPHPKRPSKQREAQRDDFLRRAEPSPVKP